MSADQNKAMAQFYLGRMMMKGEGGEKLVGVGFQLVEKAAARGVADAKAEIEKMINGLS